MTLAAYCPDCGVYLAGGMVERSRLAPNYCCECIDDGFDDDDDEPRQTLCNGTCDSCNCDVWSASPESTGENRQQQQKHEGRTTNDQKQEPGPSRDATVRE